ncbi:MAG: hypothetical protein IPG59_12905 [Candidatus Melainabacteria bacterium]|nr:MAG: hypothetical protein IPG59_12905 [Candidatus Melainabacteria bacterium]
MSQDPLLGMFLILLFVFVGGCGLGSYLLKFTDRATLQRKSEFTSAAFLVAMLIAFVAASYTASSVALVCAMFFAGIGTADSKPEESK